MSLQNVFTARNRFLLVMAVLLPLGCCWRAVAEWLLARRALKPVQRMTETAIGSPRNTLAERVPETEPAIELEPAGQDF